MPDVQKNVRRLPGHDSLWAVAGSSVGRAGGSTGGSCYPKRETTGFSALASRWTLVAISAIVAGAAVLATASTGHARASTGHAQAPLPAATGHTYFVDNRVSSCSDSGPGTAQAFPWCDFAPIERRSFGPDDAILLARGARWDQELDLVGSGAAGHPLVLGAYGHGPRPRIIRDGHNGDGALQRAVLLTNPSNVRVDSLDVGDAEVGIEAYYTTPGHQGLTFDDVATHGIHGIHEANMATVYPPDPTCNGVDSHTFPGIYVSSGVVITGPPPSFGVDQSYVTGVTVEGLTGTHNQATFSTQFCNGVDAPGGGAWPLVRDVSIRGMHLRDDDGDGVAPGCADGLHLVDTVHVRILDSTLIREGACHTRAGSTAIILLRSKDIVLANSVVAEVPDTGSFDQTGIDLEYNLDKISVLDNLIAENAGPGLTYQSFRGGDHMTETDVSDNVFRNNATAGRPPYYGSILINGTAFAPTGRIANNLYDEPTGFLRGSPPSGLTVTGNRAITGATVYRRIFKAGGIHWTAPNDGQLSLRGRAFSSTGSYSLTVRMNGRPVWSGTVTPQDWTGISAVVDNLPVRAGDDVTFQAIGAGVGESLSWSPLLEFMPM